MQRLGLTFDELAEYHRTLRTTHERRIHVEVLDLEGNVLSSLTPVATDGQVMVDTTQADTPSRILDLTFLDPHRTIQFEPDSPGAAPLHRSRMIRVIYSVRVPALERWVSCEVFTGPIWDFDRDGAEVSVVAHGKERLSLGQQWHPRTYAAKTPKTRVIKAILADTGEDRLAVPDLRVTMPHRFTIGRMASPWPRAQRVARSMDHELFYDGRGVCVLRKPVSTPLFTFGEGFLLGEPLIDRDPEGVFNIFEVLGANPKGPKKRVEASSRLPANHPLSAESLGRNGRPQFLAKRVENPHIKTLHEAQARADRLRDDSTRTLVNYQFDTLPVPHLDENDLVRVQTDDGVFLVRMQQWTLPLGWEGAPAMTVGAVRRTTRTRRRRSGSRRQNVNREAS